MTHSQINPTKVGGFSRRTLNLNHSAKVPKAIRGVPLNENAPKENTLSTNTVIIW